MNKNSRTNPYLATLFILLALVGVNSIVAETNGENLDICKWSDSGDLLKDSVNGVIAGSKIRFK